jgi:hypothetical protein
VESELYVGEQRIRFDRDATAVLYRDTITTPGADRCTCVSCKNFAARRGTIFPEDFLQLLIRTINGCSPTPSPMRTFASNLGLLSVDSNFAVNPAEL